MRRISDENATAPLARSSFQLPSCATACASTRWIGVPGAAGSNVTWRPTASTAVHEPPAGTHVTALSAVSLSIVTGLIATPEIGLNATSSPSVSMATQAVVDWQATASNG